MFKPIRDPIWGDINLQDGVKKIIDTRSIQRLRHIRQEGFTFLSVPSANHTRFEHILGTFHLLHCWRESREEITDLDQLALLHHIDDTPFTYATREIIEMIQNETWKGDAEKRKQFIKGLISTEISDNNKRSELTDSIIKFGGRELEVNILFAANNIDTICRNAYYLGLGRPTVIDAITKIKPKKEDRITFDKNIFTSVILEELKNEALTNIVAHISMSNSRMFARIVTRLLYFLYKDEIQLDMPLNALLKDVVTDTEKFLEFNDDSLLYVLDKLKERGEVSKEINEYLDIYSGKIKYPQPPLEYDISNIHLNSDDYTNKKYDQMMFQNKIGNMNMEKQINLERDIRDQYSLKHPVIIDIPYKSIKSRFLSCLALNYGEGSDIKLSPSDSIPESTKKIRIFLHKDDYNKINKDKLFKLIKSKIE
ncbi:MAG: hypothetical protein CVT88_01900 [Candidatus Altiarchaeales archaeon HGW-Altiarchaeales-1]|nr:MAG: hypothetical protein CVT88_01900 [Candidatus Altiarchaeales archaeon HGW-Altiarchaeales-1]